MSELILIPAIDLRAGKAVQLVQGIDGTQKDFGDPIEMATRWQSQGASWLHVVDLDGAFGDGSHAELVSQIISEVDIQVEVSGGIRDDASLKRILDAGATRVNIGTAALENPQWCEKVIASYGEQIAIALDVKNGQLATRAWTESGGDVSETVARLSAAGCSRFVVTDVGSDGMLTGPNFELLGSICARTSAKVVASGGISTLEDIRRLVGLVPIGVEGAIIGTALYVGNFTLTDALTVAKTGMIPG